MSNYLGARASLYFAVKYNADKNKEEEKKISEQQQTASTNTGNTTYNITIINNTDSRRRINPIVFL